MTTSEPIGQVQVIQRDRDPFMVSVMAWAVAYGVLGSVFYSTLALTSIQEYPYGGGRMFVAGLAVAGATTLLGLRWNTVTGLRVEQAGLRLLGTLLAAFAVWAPFVATVRGIGLMMLLGVFISVPSWLTARKLGKQIAVAERGRQGGVRA